MSLDRFIQAQEKTYAGALAELKSGHKSGHWIWWIFPQLRGLGTSHNSTYYGLADEVEARAYLRSALQGIIDGAPGRRVGSGAHKARP